jgi:hypothetical protein
MPMAGSLRFGCSRFRDLVVPSMMMAGSLGRYPNIAIGIDTIKIVESLANPASILTYFVSIGSVASQSANNSVQSCFGFMSSLMRTLNRSLGYSGSRDIEVEDDAASLLKGLIRPADGPGLVEEEPRWSRGFTLRLSLLSESKPVTTRVEIEC